MSEALKYDFNTPIGREGSTYQIQMMMVPDNSFVLDVGCHTGVLGAEISQKKRGKVIGVDYNSGAIEVAKTRLADAFTVDLEHKGWSNSVTDKGYGSFDVIIFGDVLEHTRNPDDILREAKALLKPEGRIIVSIPNIAHWRERLDLFFGNFNYTETGILDRTHLRFFTRRSSRELVEGAGYRIIEDTVAGFGGIPYSLLKMFPGLLAVQFVMSAVKR